MTKECRFAARFGLAVGIWTLAFTAGIVLQGCDGGSLTGPTSTTTTRTPPTAAATPVPAPIPTPAAVANPTPAGFDLACLADSTLTVKYTGQASRATIETFYTSFDNQTLEFGKQSHTVNSGDTVTRAFGKACIQGDADQPGVKLIGACFFDKAGAPFNPSRNPEKVTECRTVPCVEEWRESEPEITYGEWGACQRGETACGQTRLVTISIYETNSCTRVRRLKSTREVIDERPCECPCVETEQPRETPGAFSWVPEILQGKCEVEQFPIVIDTLATPQLDCHQNGTQKITLDWLCKADTERIRNLCRNVACPTPPPDCANTAAFYKTGANDGLFNLDNSSDASELAWVNAHVGLGPWEKFDSEGEKDDECTGADVSAKVVIVKAGSEQSATWEYRTYLNVTQGQQLCSYEPPGSSDGKDISHLSYFRCADND